MSKLTSRKLAGACAAMVANCAVVLIPGWVGFEVELPISLSAIASITGLGGYQVFTQSQIDGLEDIVEDVDLSFELSGNSEE